MSNPQPPMETKTNLFLFLILWVEINLFPRASEAHFTQEVEKAVAIVAPSVILCLRMRCNGRFEWVD